MRPDFDAAIVGGGTVGLALALALQSLSLRVAVIEAGQPRLLKAPAGTTVCDFDYRVNALNPASIAFLDSLGVWQKILAARQCPYYGMEVWDGSGTGRISFSAAEAGVAQLGSVVEDRLLRHALVERILETDNDPVCLMDSNSCTKINDCDTVLELILQDGTSINCSVLVAADGARSSVRNMLNWRWHKWDMNQVAVVCSVKTELPHGHSARQVFLPTGPLALLPLPDQHQTLCSVVWSMDRAYAEQTLSLPDKNFCSQLADRFEGRAGSIIQCSARKSFPLSQGIASPAARSRIALAGDALRTIHPLAGQGVNLGLADARTLARQLQKYGTDRPGRALKHYKSLRRLPSWRVLAAMAGFKSLFGSSSPHITWLRNTGLNSVDRLLPVKRLLIREALGSAAAE